MTDLMLNTICDYIKLAEEEIYECMKNDIEEQDISLEGAEFIHYCLENIKHLKEMKAGMRNENPHTNGNFHADVYTGAENRETDLHMANGEIDVKDVVSHKSAFGGV